MVSKASRMIAKGEMVSFETENGTVDWVIKPLKNKELLEIIDLAEKKDTKSMLNKMLMYTLEKDDPEITMQDIENMSASYLMKILKLITKVNGLEGMLDFQVSGSNTPKETSKPASREELLAKLKAKAQGQTT